MLLSRGKSGRDLSYLNVATPYPIRTLGGENVTFVRASAVKPTLPVTINLASPGDADAFGRLSTSGHYTVSVNGPGVRTWRFTVDQVC